MNELWIWIWRKTKHDGIFEVKLMLLLMKFAIFTHHQHKNCMYHHKLRVKLQWFTKYLYHTIIFYVVTLALYSIFIKNYPSCEYTMYIFKEIHKFMYKGRWLMNQYQISFNEHAVSSHFSIPHPVHSHALKYILGRSVWRKSTEILLVPVSLSHMTVN